MDMKGNNENRNYEAAHKENAAKEAMPMRISRNDI